MSYPLIPELQPGQPTTVLGDSGLCNDYPTEKACWQQLRFEVFKVAAYRGPAGACAVCMVSGT